MMATPDMQADTQEVRSPRTLPLTLGQRRLWGLAQRHAGDPAYHHLSALRLSGPVDETALTVCLRQAVARHDSLRMRFPCVNGQPVTRIEPNAELEWHRYDLSALDTCVRQHAVAQKARQEIRRPFDLEHGPLMRACLLKLEAGNAVLLLGFHHMVIDGWSLGILIEEIAAAYATYTSGNQGSAQVAPALSPYRIDDYIGEVIEASRTPAYEASLAYWKKQLDGLRWTQLAPDLQTHRHQPQLRQGKTFKHRFDDIMPLLNTSARELRVTRYQLLLAAFLRVLTCHSGNNDVAIATLLANRNERQRQRLVGYLANTVIVRHRCTLDDPVAGFVASVAATLRDLLRHGEVSLYSIAQDTPNTLAEPPSILFALQNNPLPPLQLGDVQMSMLDMESGITKFDLSIYLAEDQDGIDLWVEYDTGLYHEATLLSLVDGFRSMLVQICAALDSPTLSIGQLTSCSVPLVLLEGPRQSSRDHTSLLPTLFEHAAQRPDDIALEAQDGATTTFSQMCRLIRTVAVNLDRLGAKPGDRVAVLGERNQATLCTIWACLERGITYVPLAPDLPPAKLQLILDDAAAHHLLADGSAPNLPGQWHDVSCWLRDAQSRQSHDNVASPHHADLPAYLLYTSGTTGGPKGVLVSRANLEAFCTAMDQRVPRAPSSVWLAVSSLSFDISILELLWSMSRGFRVRIGSLAALCKPPSRDEYYPAGVLPALGLFYFGSTDDYAPADHLALLQHTAQWGDRNGFDTLWTPERHFTSFGGFFTNPALMATHLCALTQRIMIRAGSAIGPLQHTVRLAEDWATVSRLSGGRAGLSLASGWNPADFVLAHRPIAERTDTRLQQLSDLQRLWRGQTVPCHDPDGRYFEARIPLAPLAEIPLSMTVSNRPEQFEAAAEQGVDVLTHLLEQDIEQLARNIECYRRRWQAIHGEHVPPGRVVLMLHTYVGVNDADAVAIALPSLARYLTGASEALRSLAPAVQVHAQDQLIETAAQRLIAERSLVCGAPMAVERLQRLYRLGVDEVTCLIDFGLPLDTVIAGLERLAQARDAANPSAIDLAANPPATHLQCTPSAARLLLQHHGRLPAQLQQLVFWAVGGEALEDDLLRRMRMACDAPLMNLYGPTEATIWATGAAIPTRRNGPISIGTPLAGVQVYLLDDQLRPVPRGVEAQLYIGGDGIAQGYWLKPAQTAAAFVPNPFGPLGSRLYATGDRACVDAQGQLRFRGRQDTQCKINGHRVELSAMREALVRHSDVADAYILVCQPEKPQPAPTLVAFVVPHGNASATLDQTLLNHLADQWEVATLPHAFICIPEMLLTSSQKVDVRRLQALHREMGAQPLALPSKTLSDPLEQAAFEVLRDLWHEALPQFNGHANFHQAGGNSLVALQLLGRANAHFNAEVTLREFYRAPTLAGHYRALQAAKLEAQGTALVRVARGAAYPVSSAQRAMLILHGRGSVQAYHDHVVLGIQGPLSAPALEQAFTALLQRHRIFTTAYRFERGDYLQFWRDDITPDFRLANHAGDTLQSELRSFTDEPFDLENGRVIRALLVQTGAEAHCFCLVLHHIVSDGTTLRLVLAELLRDYGRIRAGERLDSTQAPWQYVDFSVWQARHLATRSEVLASFWSEQAMLCPAAPDNADTTTPLQSGPPGHLPIVIDAVAAQAVDHLTRNHRIGELSVLIAALCLAMEGPGARRTVTIATDARNRERPEFEQVPGMMVNQLLVPIRLPDSADAGEMVQACQRQLTDAFSHQAFPYEWFVAAWRKSRQTHLAPHFDAKFVLNDRRTPFGGEHGLVIEEQALPPSAAKFGILINVQRDGDRYSGDLVFDSSRHTTGAMQTLWDDFLSVLTRFVQMDNIQQERQALAARRAERAPSKQRISPATLLAQLQNARRRPAERHSAALHFIAPDAECPVPRIEPRRQPISLADAAVEARTEIVAQLRRHGALLARGFAGVGAEELNRLATTLCGELVSYTERSTPRTKLGDRLYTATEHPGHQHINLHNENAYAHQWPGTLFFWCASPATSGGENLLADSRAVLAQLPSALRTQFEQRGVLYRRELGPPLGMPWQYVFQCERREEVDAICRDAGYRVSWHSETNLSLSRIASAISTHPVTGDRSWFNHALFFHESSLDSKIRSSIRELYGEEYLPNRSFYGDGSPIGDDELAQLRAAYTHCERRLLLEKDDVLIIDNLLMAHGRCAYEGMRDVRLMMGQTIR
jgi:natural product biosynthesis luciferase-like monooxygenase protein